MSSSSSSITSTTVNGRTVISGLASGLDVDSIVQKLITAQSTKLNRLKQQQQLAEWKQEAYRSIISDIKSFYSKYFDTTSSSSILSQKTFKQLTVTSSSAVTASYTSSATAGSHTVKVSQLATAATMKTDGRLSKDIQGTTAADYTSLSGTSFVISLDGTATTVTLDSSVTDLDSLQSAIDDAVGEGKVTVSEDSSGILSITAADDSGVQEISISAPASGSSALSALGFGSGAILSNRISTSDTLEELAGAMNSSFSFNSDGQIELAINGVSFTFDKSTTLSEMISEINNSDAGVTLKYDELNDQLVMTAKTTGAQKTLSVTETDSTFLTAALSSYTAGKDAKATIDGQTLTRSTNTITVDGVTYTLNTTTGEEDATVTLTQDAEAIYDSIKSFVDDYNSLISTINDVLSEDYDSDYPPLTEDQEAEMSEEEIEKWNKKAKTGLLENDSTLQSFLDDMRTALYDSVSGVSASLTGIGITTGTYDEQGKLYIDEDKLMKAIQNNAETVADLFTQQSSTYSGTVTVRSLNSGQRQTRYKEEGLAYRLYDIIQDNISTIRDSAGNKGLLLEKAGMENDASDTDNALTDQINDYQERIDAEEERLDDEEERLYSKYTTLETYIQELNAQLAALQSYLSSSTSS